MLTTELCKNLRVDKNKKKSNQQSDITCSPAPLLHSVNIYLGPLKRMPPAADGDGGKTVRVPIFIHRRLTGTTMFILRAL
jgi:hypothetical protein